MEVWDSAKAVAADRLRAAKSESGKLEHELTVRQGWLQSLKEQVNVFLCFCRDRIPHLDIQVAAQAFGPARAPLA